MPSRSATVVVTALPCAPKRTTGYRWTVRQGTTPGLGRPDSLEGLWRWQMRVVVVGGAGAMGRWTVRDLTESEGVEEVVVADLTAPGPGGGRLGGAPGRAATAPPRSRPGPGRRRRRGAAAGLRRRRRGLQLRRVRLNLPVMEACADSGHPLRRPGGPVPHHPAPAGPARPVRGRRGHGRGRHGRQPGHHQRAGRPGRPRPGGGRGGRDPPGRGRLRPVGAPVPCPTPSPPSWTSSPSRRWPSATAGWSQVPAMSEQEELDFPPPVGRVRVGTPSTRRSPPCPCTSPTGGSGRCRSRSASRPTSWTSWPS
jgi:hypothetical protein